MPKGWLIGLMMLFIVGATAAQDAPNVSDDEAFRIQGTVALVFLEEEGVVGWGTVLTPDYILTEFYAIESYGSDFACEERDHKTFSVLQAMYLASANACLLTGNADHNFAVLQVETWDYDKIGGQTMTRAAPPLIETKEYSPIRTRLYGVSFDNMSPGSPLEFEAGTITAMSLVPPEADGQTLQQRHYLIDFQEVTYETLGGPIVDENGRVVGIANGINVDPNGERQFVRVLPLATICRVDAEVCALIQPPATFPPQDRTQVVAGIELIQTGEIDFKTRITNLCKTFGMKGDLADTESGWACWRNSGNTIGLELGALEIDMICQETYKDMAAFALLSGPDEEMAYRWRCYRPQN